MMLPGSPTRPYRGRYVTEAILTVLADAGLTAGDGEKPSTGGWHDTPGQSDFHAYVVVHPVGSGSTDGTLDEPSEDVWPIHQLTAYGANRAQCEELADDIRAVILGTSISIEGRRIGRWTIELQGVVTRVDTVQPPIWMSPDRYTAYTTPT